MTLNQPKNNELFSRKSIRNALKAWQKHEELGGHDLAQLNLVDVARKDEDYPDTLEGYGLALRGLLRETIEKLKPEGEQPTPLTKDWGGYILLKEQYVANRRRKYVEDVFGIPKDTYSKWQRSALDKVANILQERELELELELKRREKQVQAQKVAFEHLVPFMAPSLPSYTLVGRDQMLFNLKRRLFAGGSLALFALNGLPGIGKTALATTLAHDREVRKHFCDGVLWAGLGRQPDILTHLNLWGMALGIPANEMAKYSTIETRCAAIHTAIGERKILLVIDDAWEIADALTFQLGGPNCAHLLTTRSLEIALDFAGKEIQPVQELNEVDSLALLAQFVPEVLQDALRKDAMALVKAVQGLPLALTLIGKYLFKMTYQEGAERLQTALITLQHTEQRLQMAQKQSPINKQPSLPSNVPISLLASIELSDNALDGAAQQMLRALSSFAAKPNTFSREAALAIADQTTEHLKRLTDAGLIEHSGPNRYTMHQVIADYARWKNIDLQPYHRRGAIYFAQFAQQHRENDGYPLLDADWQNVSHFLQWAYENQEWQTLVDGVQGLTYFVLGVMGFMDARGHWSQAKGLLEQALEAARELNDPLLEGSILTKLGGLAFRQANFEQAELYLKQSLSSLLLLPLSVRVVLERTYLYEFMTRLEMQRDLNAAQKWAEKGLTELEPFGTQLATYQKGYFYVLLAEISGRMGEFSVALTAAEKGLALLPSSPTAAKIVGLIVLGNVSSLQGDIQKSLEYQKQGIEIAEQVGDLRRLAHLWINMGVNQRLNANFIKSITSYQKGLQLYQRMGDPYAEGRVHNNLGIIYTVLGEDEYASNYFSTAIELAQKHGVIRLEAFSKTNLAYLQIQGKKLSKASSALVRAYNICEQLKLNSLLALVLCWQAEIARLNKKHDKAMALIEESLPIANRGKYADVEGIGWSIKGKILDAMEYFDKAEIAHQKSLQILVTQDPHELGISKFAYSKHYVMRDGYLSEKAKSLLIEARDIFERLGAKREIALVKAFLNTL